MPNDENARCVNGETSKPSQVPSANSVQDPSTVRLTIALILATLNAHPPPTCLDYADNRFVHQDREAHLR